MQVLKPQSHYNLRAVAMQKCQTMFTDDRLNNPCNAQHKTKRRESQIIERCFSRCLNEFELRLRNDQW